MKTLVLYGSARKKGITRSMLDILLAEMGDSAGTVEEIDCYRTDVAPCIDCRYCWKKRGCSIKDEMQEIYPKMDAADNIIVASPVYFHSIPGKMKVLIDRFQVFWASEVRKDKPLHSTKRGAALFVGGAPAFEHQFLGAELVIGGLFKDYSTQNLGYVTFANSDRERVSDSPETLAQLKELAERFRI
ncbi:flavodoxin family protein [Sediminispirochaeta smaragdinae]|jgi:multimeric flavodoxin WrbA|uniref:NADPH-dependent FMN reductase n=1 Tax=Sediminispirochaeta smaragdinae (strain DSM 11293 / JCM 15392 / SEBR 4228) TaxID=573413 RepID=E1R544_SEDSS|nr:flavodoxin family protein [Sediminispirochaeta smaragdinae]ADK80579.1 NADPH-dependent FMN reductase [Sediminispirochaeta smaragdinae DSM 11293]